MSSASLSTPLRSLPTVCAILLTADRPEFTKGAIDCFRSQSYANKHLLIWDSGKDPSLLTGVGCSSEIFTVYDDPAGRTIGELRNRANDFRSPYWSADIFVHFDSDDHSHADRISEQVRLLQATGAGCVGYYDMMFWESPNPLCHGQQDSGRAWYYKHPSERYVLGTSMCYWTSIWRQRPFEHINVGEDDRWRKGVHCVGVSSLGRMITPTEFDYSDEPRMIARIHGKNTSSAYDPVEMARNAASLNPQWKLVPERDAQVRRMLGER